MAWRCYFERHLTALDPDIPVAHNATVHLKDSEPLGSNLGIPKPGEELLGVDRSIVAKRAPIDRDDLVHVALAKRTKAPRPFLRPLVSRPVSVLHKRTLTLGAPTLWAGRVFRNVPRS